MGAIKTEIATSFNSALKSENELNRVSLDDLPDLWHEAPPRWGHPLHSVCSYFAMFPPQLARVIIDWLSIPGEAVYDPFSGRGTVALESVLLGRTAYASDANPLAQVLSRAKIEIPSREELGKRLLHLEDAYRHYSAQLNEAPPQIRMLYSDSTLKQLLFLKKELKGQSSLDNFLIAMILGMLHANHGKNGAARGFSVSMPNTFAMSPGYVQRYIRDNNLKKPDVNVFDMLRARMDRLHLSDSALGSGVAWLQDATENPPQWLARNKPHLVLTSPPYLQVIKYGKYNWVRLWFLGEDPKQVDTGLMATASLSRYMDFMRTVSSHLMDIVDQRGFVCLIIGDVRIQRKDDYTIINLAQEVWSQVLEPMGWYLHGIVADILPPGRKVSRIWKHNSGNATKIDRLIIMSPSAVPLPPISRFKWKHAVKED